MGWGEPFLADGNGVLMENFFGVYGALSRANFQPFKEWVREWAILRPIVYKAD